MAKLLGCHFDISRTETFRTKDNQSAMNINNKSYDTTNTSITNMKIPKGGTHIKPFKLSKSNLRNRRKPHRIIHKITTSNIQKKFKAKPIPE